MCLLSSVEFLCFASRNDAVCPGGGRGGTRPKFG